MKVAWLIARRELSSYFSSFSGYIIVAVVLLLDGLLFNGYVLGGTKKLSTQVTENFFYIASGTTMVAGLFLSMRLVAEERQNGSLVLLFTSPVRDWQIVLGKFLSAFLFLAFMVICTSYMPLLILANGKVSLGHLLAGYAGLLLLGGSAVAIGLFASSIAPNQLLAVIVGAGILVAMLLFHPLIARKGRSLHLYFRLNIII